MDTKRCKTCNEEKAIDSFYKSSVSSDGLYASCKICVRKQTRENYRKNIEYYHAYDRARNQRPERKKALAEKNIRLNKRADYAYKNITRLLTQEAIRKGKIVKTPCQVCGDADSQVHHLDYHDPLNVQWLCFKHHREAHGQVVSYPDWKKERKSRKAG